MAWTDQRGTGGSNLFWKITRGVRFRLISGTDPLAKQLDPMDPDGVQLHLEGGPYDPLTKLNRKKNF